MAARATAPKLQVKYDAGLLKIKDFIEPLAQLRSHPTIKVKQAKLRTHDLEFPLAKEADSKKGPIIFRAIITRRHDINEQLWAKIDQMAKISDCQDCCVFVITGSIPIPGDRSDLKAFDKRLNAIEPGPVPAMPVEGIIELVNPLVRMHLYYRKISNRLESFGNNMHAAYNQLMELTDPSAPVSDAMIKRLVEAYPSLEALVAAAARPMGRSHIREIAGQERGARFLALLDRSAL